MIEFSRKTTFVVAVAALIFAAAGPAFAQQTRVYVCTDNTRKGDPVHRYMFGAGEFRTFDTPIYTSGGAWSANLCSFPDSKCRYDGPRFSASQGKDWDFTYDGSTGAYTYGDEATDMTGGDEGGTCRPE